jgi:hypothetical protein
MLAKFRSYYPQGSLISELIDIDRGLYLVKVSIKVDGVILATGLAAADRLETAEDSARERAISALVLDNHQPAYNQVLPVSNQTQEPNSNSKVVKFSEHQAEKVSQPHTFSQTVTPFRSPAESFLPENLPTQLSISSQVLPVQESSSLLAETFQAETTDLDSSEDKGDRQNEIFSANLNSFPATIDTVDIDFNKIKQQTDIEIKRLGWTKDDGRDFLKSRYGKRSRLHLTDDQLLEFLRYLEGLPNPGNN